MSEVEDFKSFVHSLESCCWHESNWPVDSVVAVIAWVKSEGDGPAGGALVRFVDGKYGTFEESQDYTGHG